MIKSYYEEENIQIYCGDCLEIMPQLPQVDLVLTDPPYGVNFRDNEWDKEIPNWLPQARLISKSVMFVTGTLTMWDYPRPSWVICWARPASNSRSKIGGFSHWSPILVYGDLKIPVDFKSYHAITNAYPKGFPHPSPKPIKIIKWLVSVGTKHKDLILDPFLGSGTTLVACKELGRRGIGIEISKEYCDIAVKRLKNTQKDMFL